MARASFLIVPLILSVAGTGLLTRLSRVPARASSLSNLLVSHLSNKVIQPSPDSTDRETDSATCGKGTHCRDMNAGRREQRGGY